MKGGGERREKNPLCNGPWPGLYYSCHGASCLQANDAERRKNDRLKEKERERKKDPTRVDTAIYRKKKRGSCLNCKAAKVSSGQEPGTQSGPRPVTIPGFWPELTLLALWFRQEPPPFITVNSGVRPS